MPVIFVHGVNNRKESPGFEAGQLAISKFLQKSLSNARFGDRTFPTTFSPQCPYWGGLATKFAWGMRSLPSGEIDALGGPAVESDLRPLIALVKDVIGDGAIDVREPILTLARRSFPLSIDLLGETLLLHPLDRTTEQVAEFIVAAQMYACKFEPPASPLWLAAVTTDAQLLAQLLAELRIGASPEINALGIFDTVGNALSAASTKLKHAFSAAKGKIFDKVGDLASTKVLAWSRAPLNATLGRFFGDVFVYLDGRGKHGSPGPIPELLLSAWDNAVMAAPAEPIVIIGHSLGGVISYDLLSHFRPDFRVDLFVSVGSQISHFEEMKLFLASDKSIPGSDFSKRVPKPTNIIRWINVFDEVDIFSYSCKAIFKDVDDFRYDTGTYVIKAHGSYLMQGRFYQRLRARIDGQ